MTETVGPAVTATIAMLGAFACFAGGVYLLAKRQDRTKGVLLLVMAIVLVGNVAIMTL